MRGRRAATLGSAAAVAIAAAGARAQPVDVVIGHRSSSGRHATATAYVNTGRFDKLLVHVTATPNQRATGFWG